MSHPNSFKANAAKMNDIRSFSMQNLYSNQDEIFTQLRLARVDESSLDEIGQGSTSMDLDIRGSRSLDAVVMTSSGGAASPGVFTAVLDNLESVEVESRRRAAADLEILVASSFPKGGLWNGSWHWTAQGADENRSILGGSKGLWASLLKIISSKQDPELVAMVCGAMSKLGFRHTYNVLNMMKYDGMHNGIMSLLGHTDVSVQRGAWRILHNFCSGIDEVKVIICRFEGLESVFASACTSEDEEVRRRAVSVIMHCSSSEPAKHCLLDANVFKAALEPILSSSNEELATRIRATLASANMYGKEERSYLTTAPELLRHVVDVTSHSLDEQEYCGIKWSLNGVMLPLFNLSVSDTNKVELIRFGIVGVLLRVIEFGQLTDNTQEMALRTLANLTFDRMAMKEMVSMDALEILGAVVTQANGESCNSKEVAEDLVYMITGGQDLDFKAAPSQPTHRPCSHIMISYSWLEKKRNVVTLTGMLRKRGLDVWRDEEGSSLVKRISGSSMDIMAEAIEVAEFVVVFVSRAYRDSYNCKLEGKYAQIRERAGLATIIYVMMEEDYTPQSESGVDGWLGIMIGDSIWYRGWDTNYLQEAADGIELAASRGTTNCFLNRNNRNDFANFERTDSGHASNGSAGSQTVSRTGSSKSGATSQRSGTQEGPGAHNMRISRTPGMSTADILRAPSGMPPSPLNERVVGHSHSRSNSVTSETSQVGDFFPGETSPFPRMKGAGESRDQEFSPGATMVKSSIISRRHSSQGFSASATWDATLSERDRVVPQIRRSGSEQVLLGGDSHPISHRSHSASANIAEGDSSIASEPPGFGLRMTSRRTPDPFVSPMPDGIKMAGLSLARRKSQDAHHFKIESHASHTPAYSSDRDRSGQPSPEGGYLTTLTPQMWDWIAAHKLEGLIDIFRYHCVDDPETAGLLTEEMVNSFTDKIGLRMRLIAAIEIENQKHVVLFPRASSSSSSIDSAGALFVYKRGTPSDSQSSSSTTMIQPVRRPPGPGASGDKIESPLVVIDYTSGYTPPEGVQLPDYHF